jgi:hypothetical protein
MSSVSGFTEMSSAALFDRRRNRCAEGLFDSLCVHHTGSFSAAVGDAGRQAAHRLFEVKGLKPAAMLSGHVAACNERVLNLRHKDDYILVAQDTTEANYTSLRKTTGLGPIGRGTGSAKGLESHSALAMLENGMPVGVVHLDIWARKPVPVGRTAKEKAKAQIKKPTSEKESKKWLECVRRVQTLFPPEVKLLFIQDREADIFDLFLEPRRPGTDLLVRAAQSRRVQAETDDPDAAIIISTLFKTVRATRVLGTTTVTVSATPTRKERTAVLEIRSCPVLLCAPVSHRVNPDRTPQPVWLVSAREADPPAGAVQVDWTLISTIPAPTFEDACRIVTYYSRRWLIERLHYVLKSGLNAEGLRFDDADSLANALALYYIVAWQLLRITYLARMDPEQPAAISFEQTEIEILSQAQGKQIETISSAVIAVAKLGGYTYYRNAAPPGVKTIWLGLRKLEQMLAGYLLAVARLKDVNH